MWSLPVPVEFYEHRAPPGQCVAQAHNKAQRRALSTSDAAIQQRQVCVTNSALALGQGLGRPHSLGRS